MKTIGSYEAKARLAAILRDVEAGETVTITRNGLPVARLSLVEPERKRDPAGAMARLLSSKATLGGLSIRSLRDAGGRR